jgi:2-succinyl-5-enolpyruvyl-6-hydroxy-3-cyclohexene-1-carboxylate synthase
VHLNVGFVEPLIATALSLPGREEPLDAGPRRDQGHDLDSLDLTGRATLCVVGRGATPTMIDAGTALGWVVVGDATARGTVAHYDALLRSDDFARRARPDIVVRLGGLPASKVLGERLREWGAPTIALSGAGFVADPDRLVSDTYAGVPSSDIPCLRASEEYAQMWRNASSAVEQWLEKIDDDAYELSEPLVARLVVAVSNEADVALVVGSSMPVRDVEWWAPSRRTRVFANRGANGIDGVVSTAFGVAAGSRAVALVGDLTMLHDVSALVDGLGAAGGTCVLVVVDNQGGGIFSFLPQATSLDNDRFELLFGTPRRHELDAVAKAFGHDATIVTSVAELRSAIDKGLASEGIHVVVARVPSRGENVEIHERWNAQVRALVEMAS